MKPAETIEQKINKAKQLKAQGNQLFKKNQLPKALRCYHQANLYITGIIDKQSPMAMYTTELISDDDKSQIDQLKFVIYMNMAQVYITQKKYDKSLQKLEEASKIKHTTKLKYRKAITYYYLGDFQKAGQLFKQVSDEDQTMKKDIDTYMKKIKEQEKLGQEKSKKMFQKFFSSDKQGQKNK